MSLNVNRNVTDTFYRYKMPRLIAKVEGKGNGIKTVIVNMVDVAKAISRPPTYPTKYFGCELGAQTQFDFKNDRYIVNGSHEAGKLQSLLDGFIKKYVLCPECDNPETVLHPNEKKGIIRESCKACGHQCMVDMRHKLTTFILKNPPDVKPDQQGTSLTKRKSHNKKDGEKNDHGDKSPRDDDMDDTYDDDDENWSVGVTEEDVKERMKGLSTGVKSLTASKDEEKPLSQRLEIFYKYCENLKNSCHLVPGADMTIFWDVIDEAERLDIKENKGLMILVELLFDCGNIIELIPIYRVLFVCFTFENPKGQRYLLGAIEKMLEIRKDLIPKVPLIMKTLYDNDYVDEEVFFEWGKKASKKFVSKETALAIQAKAQPFLKWLKEADEESSDDSTPEFDLEIEYNDKASSQTLKEQAAAKNKKEAGPAVAQLPPGATAGEDDQNDGSDVDIDGL